MSNNAESWNQPNVVSFFDNQRTTTSDVYPSEWFFLKDQLQEGMSILDIGCAKGFMLFDLLQVMPELNVFGIDISEYAINNAKEEVKEYCRVANAIDLPFEDKSVDIILSITTLHNLDEDEIKIAISEIERVKIRGSFITVDAYRDDYEKDLMESWNLTAKTVMHVDKWKEFFHDNGYTGDYYWFIP